MKEIRNGHWYQIKTFSFTPYEEMTRRHFCRYRCNSIHNAVSMWDLKTVAFHLKCLLAVNFYRWAFERAGEAVFLGDGEILSSKRATYF